MAVHDITLALDEGQATFPGDEPLRLERRATMERDGCRYSLMSLPAHCGTHLDAPAHFLAEGPTIDHFPAGSFVLPAVVIHAPATEAVEAAAIEATDVAAGEALLIRANATDQREQNGWAALSPGAADACLERGVALLGIDAPSVDPADSRDFPAHYRLLGAGTLVLENADLSAVGAGRYTLVALPLKLTGCEASPVRAVLLD